MRTTIQDLKRRAKIIMAELYILIIALQDPRTPRFSKLLIFIVLLYAVSPLDLIPDFIPVIGYLDDLILIPLGMLLVIKTIPKQLLVEFRSKAKEDILIPEKLKRVALLNVILIWIILVVVSASIVFHKLI
jgi:uncharacterized membrane protein YkvA (DUF1232 family)